MTGAVLGLGQWLLLRRRGVDQPMGRRIPPSASAVGLTVGAAARRLRNRHRVSLAVMGAVSGLAVGLAQAGSASATGMSSVLTWGRHHRRAVGARLDRSAPSSASTPTDQWPIFGASGALVVTLVQSTFIERVLPLQTKTQKVTS